MRVIFCARKNVSLLALDHILKLKWQVLAVAPKTPEPEWAEKPTFEQGLEQRKIKYAHQDQVLEAIAGKSSPKFVKQFLARPVDLVISYLFPEKIKSPLLKLPTLAAINFHPGPLPEYGGRAGYNYAILERRKTYGVTAHHMEETFDTGDIILKRKFKFNAKTATALELEQITRPHLLNLFYEVVAMIQSKAGLPRRKQGRTRYVTRQEFEEAKQIDPVRENAEQIEAKARAFWYPPYEGAFLDIGGRHFTIIPEEQLKLLAGLVHQKKKD